MKHFNFKTLAMGAALAGSLFTTNAAQAQDKYTDPTQMEVGYYHVVSASNPDYAWTVLPSKEMAIAKLDKTKPEFVWFLTGRNGTGNESEIGTKITNQGSAHRLRFRFGNPAWTTAETFYAMGGLDANTNKQLFLISTEWGMHNWKGYNAEGFRFNASNRGYDVMPNNKQWVSGTTLWFNNDSGEDGRWKLEPVDEATLTALKAITDVEAFIAGLPTYEKEQAVAASGVIAAASELKDMKANVGTAQGQYNFTPEASDADLWNNIDSYTDASSDVYTDADLNALLTQMQALAEKVGATLVAYDLNLADVNIVTLQYNGNGRYTGLNQSTNWEGDNGFGSPNGGNGKLGLIKVEEGRYAIASQGIYLKVEGNTITNAYTLAEATAFITTRTTENGLTFKTEDGKFLSRNNSNITIVVDEKPASDFKLNTYDTNNGYYMKAAENVYQVGDVYMSAICLPYKVQKPEGDGFHTYTVNIVNNELVTTEVDIVEAGVPFIFVSPTNDDSRRLIIPQTNQAYADTPSDDSTLKGWFHKSDNGANDNPKNLYFGVKNGTFGFYNDIEANEEVNQACIKASVANDLGAVYFVWNAETSKLEAVTQTYQVTYNAIFNGKTIKSETVTVAEGAEPVIPTSFAAAFTTLEFAVGTPETITDNATITVNADWNPPFKVSTSIANAHWYNLDIRNGHWVRVHDREPYQPIVWGDVTNNELLSDAYQWAFMGTPYDLYVYNKSTGEKTWTDADENVVMRDGEFSWELVKNDNTNSKVFVLREDGTNKYINQSRGSGNNRDLIIWNSTAGYNDPGCEFIAYEVPSLHELTINGWASLYLDYNAAIPTGVNAYYVSAVNGGYATLTQIEDAIPANTAVLLEGDGEYTFEYAAEASTIEGNLLKGTTTKTLIEAEANTTYYVLSKVGENIGLYKASINKDESGNTVETGGTHFYNNANKVYLPVETTAGAPMLSFERGEGTTSIDNGQLTMGNVVIYDLLGRRVQTMERGIYIVNGKKVVIK